MHTHTNTGGVGNMKQAAQVKDQLGLALGITYNGKVLFFGSAGSTEKGNMLRPTLDTVVSIGSITKIFTTRLSSHPFPTSHLHDLHFHTHPHFVCVCVGPVQQ